VSRSNKEDTVVLDEFVVEGTVSTGSASEVEMGERDEEDDVMAAGWSTCE
jgi:hypothetical protein